MPRRHVSLAFVAALLAVAPVARAAVVVNEFDYDQPGTDTAEFIELKNTGATAVSLGTYSLVLVNGNDGLTYRTVTLPGATLAAGGYYVIGFGSANPWHADFTANTLDNSVQNGSPDAIALFDGATLVDVVSYEGSTVAPYTEGTGTTAADDNITAMVGLSRYPDGQDTNDNNADFSLHCITPGGPNTFSTGGCLTPVPTVRATWGALKATYR